MITYTVLDPDDGTGRTYWWYGDAMVYVHQDGVEIDAFEVDADDGDVIDQALVESAVLARHGATDAPGSPAPAG